MLNSEDLSEINTTLNVIEHVKDAANPALLKTPPLYKTNLSLLELLNIVSFILLSAKDIFYTKEGKPRNFISLVGNVGKIITFVRDLVRMINRDTREKKAGKKQLKDGGITSGGLTNGKEGEEGVFSGTWVAGKNKIDRAKIGLDIERPLKDESQ